MSTRKNYQSDFSYIEHFGRYNSAGEFIVESIPADADIKIVLFADGRTTLEASRVKGVYDHCEVIDSSSLKVYVPLSITNLGIGELKRKMYIKEVGGFWEDADTTICIPNLTNITLWDGPSDNELSPSVLAILGAIYKGRDGVDGGYRLQTKKINSEPQVTEYDFHTVIEGLSDDQLLELQDSDKYRLVLMTFRKHPHEGRRWRIPMLPYLLSQRTGKNVNSLILETDTWWPVTGRITPWFRDGRKLDDAVWLTVRAGRRQFKSTRNCQKRVGVALFKYTGSAGEGWTRISNISYVELFISQAGFIRFTVRE